MFSQDSFPLLISGRLVSPNYASQASSPAAFWLSKGGTAVSGSTEVALLLLLSADPLTGCRLGKTGFSAHVALFQLLDHVSGSFISTTSSVTLSLCYAMSCAYVLWLLFKFLFVFSCLKTMCSGVVSFAFILLQVHSASRMTQLQVSQCSKILGQRHFGYCFLRHTWPPFLVGLQLHAY